MSRNFTMDDVTVLHEDNSVLVVVKPQNIPSQADKSGDLDLLTLLKSYIKEKYNKPGNVYLGLVHRLDRPTGGVMVFAKNSKSAERLSKQIVDADKYTAWRKQKILSFENEKLSMIIPRLEQWYGRKVMCQKDLADKYRFTFKVRDESLDRILFMIKASSPLQYKEEKNGDYTLTLK